MWQDDSLENFVSRVECLFLLEWFGFGSISPVHLREAWQTPPCPRVSDHPPLHAQVPAPRSRHQEGLQQRTVSKQAGAQRRGSQDLQLPGDRLHHRHRLSEPAGGRRRCPSASWVISISIYVLFSPTFNPPTSPIRFTHVRKTRDPTAKQCLVSFFTGSTFSWLVAAVLFSFRAPSFFCLEMIITTMRKKISSLQSQQWKQTQTVPAKLSLNYPVDFLKSPQLSCKKTHVEARKWLSVLPDSWPAVGAFKLCYSTANYLVGANCVVVK